MLSFIVPAHNEQACLPATLQSIHESAKSVNQPYEILVVDDASTDATADIAAAHNARVIPVAHRQIAATRNSGARAATGDRFFFIDADTTINPRVVASALFHMDRGAAGGGAPARFDRNVPLYAPLLLWWMNWMMWIGGICGGACLFCTRDAYNATGGFDEKLFGAEDAAFSWAIRRHGRFVILWRHVTTSGRRVRGGRGSKILGSLIAMAFFPQMLRRRASVEKVWYDSNRQGDERLHHSLLGRVTDAVLLLIILAIITGPLWNLMPWSLTPPESALGKARITVAVFSCHLALVLWPCAYFVLRALLKQTRWLERLKLLGLLALCLWFAWGATPVVIGFWAWLYRWLVGSS